MNPNLRRPVAARPGKASRRAPTLPHANVGFTAPPVQNVRYVTTPQTPFDASYYNASDDNSWHNHSMQNYTSPSPMTVSSVSPRGWSPTPMEQRSGGAASPYGFVPIGTTATAMTAPSISHGRFTPPTSPYGATGCWKPTRHGTVSPSMMSILTEDTVDTASLTVDTNSFRFTPVSARPSPRPWERPATPSSTTSTANTATGRKSPYAKKQTAQDDDSSTRKIRIKTEMCMHYSSGKVCPFGAGTYKSSAYCICSVR